MGAPWHSIGIPPSSNMKIEIAYMQTVCYIGFTALGWPGGRQEQDHGSNRLGADEHRPGHRPVSR
jgi:hypothetical protein